jgi:hypothetical protein
MELERASFTPMSGCFSLIDDYANPYHFPPDRLVEARPCLDVFAREGALVEGTQATLQIGSRGRLLAARDAGIWIDGNRIAVRSHTALPLRVFICPV